MYGLFHHRQPARRNKERHHRLQNISSTVLHCVHTLIDVSSLRHMPCHEQHFHSCSLHKTYIQNRNFQENRERGKTTKTTTKKHTAVEMDKTRSIHISKRIKMMLLLLRAVGDISLRKMKKRKRIVCMHNQLERSIRVASETFSFCVPTKQTQNIHDSRRQTWTIYSTAKMGKRPFRFLRFLFALFLWNWIDNLRSARVRLRWKMRDDLSMGKLRMVCKIRATTTRRTRIYRRSVCKFKFRCYAIFARLLLLEQQRNTHYFTF